MYEEEDCCSSSLNTQCMSEIYPSDVRNDRKGHAITVGAKLSVHLEFGRRVGEGRIVIPDLDAV